MRKNASGFVLLLSIWLSGCATSPVPPLPASDLMLKGKVGVIWPGESFSARFHWQQAGADYRLELWGPFGQGRVILDGDERWLKLRDGRGKLLDEGPVEQVMARQLGWALPLAALPAWSGGEPSRAHPFVIDARDDQGRVTDFRQFGWRVRVETFAGSGEPERLRLDNDPYRVRIAVSERRHAVPASARHAGISP